MKVTFIRHGETPANVAGTMQDFQADMKLELTERWIEQAKELWKLLKDEYFDAIYVSDMRRTQQTARYIFWDSADFVLEPRIREHFLTLRIGISYNYNEIWREKWTEMRLAWFEDGETFQQQIDRVHDFIKDLSRKDYKNVAIVTHGGSMRALYVIAWLYSHREALLVDSVKNCGTIKAEIDSDGSLIIV